MKIFRTINETEAQTFKAWARKNYAPLSPIQGFWHPVVQAECVAMNAEANADGREN